MRNYLFLKGLLIFLLLDFTLQQPWIRRKDPDPRLYPPPEVISRLKPVSPPSPKTPLPEPFRPPDPRRDFPTTPTPKITDKPIKNPYELDPRKPPSSEGNPYVTATFIIFCCIIFVLLVLLMILKCHRTYLMRRKRLLSSEPGREENVDYFLHENENCQRKLNSWLDKTCLTCLHFGEAVHRSQEQQQRVAQLRAQSQNHLNN